MTLRGCRPLALFALALALLAGGSEGTVARAATRVSGGAPISLKTFTDTVDGYSLQYPRSWQTKIGETSSLGLGLNTWSPRATGFATPDLNSGIIIVTTHATYSLSSIRRLERRVLQSGGTSHIPLAFYARSINGVLFQGAQITLTASDGTVNDQNALVGTWHGTTYLILTSVDLTSRRAAQSSREVRLVLASFMPLH